MGNGNTHEQLEGTWACGSSTSQNTRCVPISTDFVNNAA